MAKETGQALAVMEPAVVAHDIELRATIEETLAQVNAVQELQRRMLKPDVDYGVIPGTPKPTLYKPGAEKLLAHFKLSVADALVEKEDLGEGHLDYVVRLPIVNRSSGEVVGVGVGSCSTKERKYQRNSPFDIRNTVLKMAKKRALVDAALTTTAASHVFTQDIEELVENGVMSIKGAAIAEAPAGRKKAAAKAAPAEQKAPAKAQPSTRPATQRIEVDPDFDAPEGEFVDATIHWGQAKVTTSGKPYLSYKLTCEQTGKTGWVSCWDEEAAAMAMDTQTPAQFRGKVRMKLRQGKGGFWAVEEFELPGSEDFDLFEDVDLGPPLDMSNPLFSPGD
jgi:ribosomal protein L12E/L44/L45/RPP1/RPP2